MRAARVEGEDGGETPQIEIAEITEVQKSDIPPPSEALLEWFRERRGVDKLDQEAIDEVTREVHQRYAES